MRARASAEIFPGRGTTLKKRQKNSKKTPKNSTVKPLSNIFVPCMKILGRGMYPLPPAADAHG